MFLKKKGGAVEWLVVCLGNPGIQYSSTRHNVGFHAADALEERCGVRLNRLKFQALTGEVRLGGSRVLVLKPQTMMNRSGQAVQQAAAFYKIPPERVLVIFDDISLPVGKLRVRPGGSAGGHNGVKNIIACLGSDGFPRVKSVWGKSRIRTMIWRPGCWAVLRRRNGKRWKKRSGAAWMLPNA